MQNINAAIAGNILTIRIDLDAETGRRVGRKLAAALKMYKALEFIVNDAPEGEDAVLSAEGYNRACAALAEADGTA